MGGGVDRWGANRPSMKKVLLGESEVILLIVYIVNSKFGQIMDKL